jgi:hypothetical protein
VFGSFEHLFFCWRLTARAVRRSGAMFIVHDATLS